MERTGLRSHNLFQMLQPKQVESISNATEEVELNAGDVVYHAGDPANYFFVVREGKVTLHSVTGDVRLNVDEVLPGEVFGTCLCLSRDTYTLEARCEEKTRLMRIPADALTKTLRGDPVLGYTVQGYISGIYFRRYIEAVTRLQGVAQSLSLRPY